MSWDLLYESAARQPDQEPACEIFPPLHELLPKGHEGHHPHSVWVGLECSCGLVLGLCCYVIPDWTITEWDAWERANVCSICGKEGVIERD